MTAELGLQPAAADSSAEQVSSSELFAVWEGDRETDGNVGMMWNLDLSSSVLQPQHPPLDEPNGGAAYLDILQLELLKTDDVLPPLVEERESNNLLNDLAGTVAVPSFGENVNQQLRGHGPARAHSRAACPQPTSEEAQQCSRSSNDGLYSSEATPHQRMSITNLRGPEVSDMMSSLLAALSENMMVYEDRGVGGERLIVL